LSSTIRISSDLYKSGKSEITNFANQRALLYFAHEDILKLDVTMHNFLSMHNLDSLQYLVENINGFVELKDLIGKFALY